MSNIQILKHKGTLHETALIQSIVVVFKGKIIKTHCPSTSECMYQQIADLPDDSPLPYKTGHRLETLDAFA